MDSMHEILVKVRNEIDRRGHVQNVLERDGSVCLYGGLNLVVNEYPGNWVDYGLAEHFAAVLGFEEPEEGTFTENLCIGWVQVLTRRDAAVAWNNALGRTKEEVLARLDEAIARTAPAPEDPMTGVQTEEMVMV